MTLLKFRVYSQLVEVVLVVVVVVVDVVEAKLEMISCVSQRINMDSRILSHLSKWYLL